MPWRLTVPDGLRASPRWWHDDPAWLDGLPALCDELLQAWGLLPDGEPRHGSNALVLPVRRGAEPLALRLCPADDLADDLRAVRFWAGRGTVEGHAADPRGAMLLERLDPDRTARGLDVDPAAEVLGGLMRRLAVPAPAWVSSTARLVAERASTLREENARLGTPVAPETIAAALAVASELIAIRDAVAVNLDLHHDQVLAGVREPWLCVDPRLGRGDVVFDLARCVWTRADELADDFAIRRQVTIMADAAEVDRDHAVRAALFRTVDYWLWGLDHGLTEDPVRCGRIARALLPSVT